eukprot:9483870-Pyramimonas_sp.AAC.4
MYDPLLDPVLAGRGVVRGPPHRRHPRGPQHCAVPRAGPPHCRPREAEGGACSRCMGGHPPHVLPKVLLLYPPPVSRARRASCPGVFAARP